MTNAGVRQSEGAHAQTQKNGVTSVSARGAPDTNVKVCALQQTSVTNNSATYLTEAEGRLQRTLDIQHRRSVVTHSVITLNN